jgi:hypothetical protein
MSFLVEEVIIEPGVLSMYFVSSLPISPHSVTFESNCSNSACILGGMEEGVFLKNNGKNGWFNRF